MASLLVGEVALVTGGGRGIGRIIANALAREGAAVAVMARTASEIDATAAEIVDRGGTAAAVRGDVTDRATVEQIMVEVERRLGPLTLVVNNAGTCRVIGPLTETDPEQWWREVEIHVRGAALVSHYALRVMVPRRRGRIVNIYGNLGDH
jgi:NAD(P)-dependent dehydrogenase (short-subunit alcohol dehydrogenase family)